jgi:hypothetical protein
MNKHYDFTNVDSVSITLMSILIITLLFLVPNLYDFLRKKYSVDEGNDVRVTLQLKLCFVIVTDRSCVIQLGLMRDVIWSNYIRSRTEKM